jgi:hypothetical protein
VPEKELRHKGLIQKSVPESERFFEDSIIRRWHSKSQEGLTLPDPEIDCS